MIDELTPRPPDSGKRLPEDVMYATHGPIRVVETTALEPIDLVAWARRYAALVIEVETASDGSAAA